VVAPRRAARTVHTHQANPPVRTGDPTPVPVLALTIAFVPPAGALADESYATPTAVAPLAAGRLHGPDDAQVDPARGRRRGAALLLLTGV
jgi:hypothetical protein